MKLRIRTLFRWPVRIVGGLLLLVLLLPFLLNIHPLQRSLLTRLNQQLDGRFELGGLSLAPYSIRLELHDLVLLDAANDTLAFVAVDRIWSGVI